MQILICIWLWTNCVPQPNSYFEVLTPYVLAFGGGAFGSSLGLDEVMRLGPS